MTTKPKASDRITSANNIPVRQTHCWFEFYGHVTTVTELARIFDISVHTLRQRVKAGWPLEAALMADPADNWTINNIELLQSQEWVLLSVEARVKAFFAPEVKSPLKRKGGK